VLPFLKSAIFERTARAGCAIRLLSTALTLFEAFLVKELIVEFDAELDVSLDGKPVPFGARKIVFEADAKIQRQRYAIQRPISIQVCCPAD
jgi:hypothetical protein